MALKLGTPQVRSRERIDRDSGKTTTVYTICVTVENDDETADAETGVSIYYQDRSTAHGTPPGAAVSTICTKTVRVPKRRVIRDAAGNVIIEANGSIEVCCELPGQPANGQEFVAVGGTTRDSDGDVKHGGAGNFYSPTLTYERPRRVAVRPGQRLQYSSLLGVGFDQTELLGLGGALEVPPGWSIDFPAALSKGPYPVAFEFSVQVRPGAAAGEGAKLILRSFLPGEGGTRIQCEETMVHFVVEPELPCSSCGKKIADS